MTIEAKAVPSLPSEPMSVPEYNRRREAAGLMPSDTYTGEPYGYADDPDGQCYVYPTPYGGGFGGRKLVRIERVELKSSDGAVVARIDEDGARGWEELGPSWRKLLLERFDTLLSPAELTLPKMGGGDAEVVKGMRARITEGDDAGVEGEVFWLGPSKYDDGTRAGLKEASGKKHWVDAAHLQPADDGDLAWTPLHDAIDAYDSELVAAILGASTDWLDNATDDQGRKSRYGASRYYGGSTPLHVAAARGAADIVELLLDHGADPDCADILGNTPLHRTHASDAKIVEALLEAGADVNATNARGETFADLLADQRMNKTQARGLLDTVARLGEAGADLSSAKKHAMAHQNDVLFEAFAEYN